VVGGAAAGGGGGVVEGESDQFVSG
jgi:hypothetical protein